MNTYSMPGPIRLSRLAAPRSCEFRWTRAVAGLLPIVATLSALAGCSTLWHGGGYQEARQGASSSLVDFLYPGGEVPPPPDDTLPVLNLPLKVGLAFVPAADPTTLSASEKQMLLEHVADAFRDRPFVSSIEIIPESYLRSVKGTRGMQQVASMFGADVMALVSYDQLTLSGERDSALLYWTIVGALVVKGNTNEVQTMIDTAVFDARSTRLLFRAPGVYNAQRNATLVESAQDLRRLSSESFVAATDDMIVNLGDELERFQDAVKQGERANVAWQEGAGGGGGGCVLPLVVVLALACRRVAARAARRREIAAAP